MMPVLSAVEAQLSLYKCNIAKAVPEAREWQDQGQKLCSCYSTPCPVSELHDLVDQLESISPPVGGAATFIRTL